MKLPTIYRDEARDDAYEYFDKNIRQLKKDGNGKVDPEASGLENNDVDAFRHAYVSGVFTQVYSEETADILERLNEYITFDLYSNSKDPRSLNMDLWNNAVGRKYGKKATNRQELLKLIHEALKNGELIIDIDDSRKYEGASNDPSNKSKPLVVLEESDRGSNLTFLDMVSGEVMGRDTVVARIEAGSYPNYTVKVINGISTPVSKPDGRETNNLS